MGRSNSTSVISHPAGSFDAVVFSARYNRPDPRSAGLSAAHNSLLALAIGAGSVFFCPVNDAGFWMVRELTKITTTKLERRPGSN
jgi:hypothetical protein